MPVTYDHRSAKGEVFIFGDDLEPIDKEGAIRAVTILCARTVEFERRAATFAPKISDRKDDQEGLTRIERADLAAFELGMRSSRTSRACGILGPITCRRTWSTVPSRCWRAAVQCDGHRQCGAGHDLPAREWTSISL
jgi:hypothetical protein